MPATRQKIQALDALEVKSKQLNEEGKGMAYPFVGNVKID